MEIQKHIEFGCLKGELCSTSNEIRREELIRRMRDNLLERNESEIIHLNYSNEVVNICECEVEKLFHADATLYHFRR